jgi:hypothetical protein
MMSLMMRQFAIGTVIALFAAIASNPLAKAQSLPTTDEFDQEVRVCLTVKKIVLPEPFIASVIGMYRAVNPYGAPSFASRDQFEAQFAGLLVGEALRLYPECISRIITPRTPKKVPQERECIQQSDLSRTARGEEVIIGLDCEKLSEVVGHVDVVLIYVCSRLQYELKVDQTGRPVALKIVPVVACLTDKNPGDQGCDKNRGTCFKLKYKTLS